MSYATEILWLPGNTEKHYIAGLAATAQKVALAARIAKRSRASVDNFDIPPVPAQTHDNNSPIIEILSSGSESGYYGRFDTILSSDVTSELSEDSRQLEQLGI